MLHVTVTPKEMLEAHGLFHRLWGEAVGSTTYDKKQWQALELVMDKSFCIILGVNGGWIPEARLRVDRPSES